MKTLVIYFSQTGKTKEAAERIAQLSGADHLMRTMQQMKLS